MNVFLKEGKGGMEIILEHPPKPQRDMIYNYGVFLSLGDFPISFI